MKITLQPLTRDFCRSPAPLSGAEIRESRGVALQFVEASADSRLEAPVEAAEVFASFAGELDKLDHLALDLFPTHGAPRLDILQSFPYRRLALSGHCCFRLSPGLQIVDELPQFEQLFLWQFIHDRV